MKFEKEANKLYSKLEKEEVNGKVIYFKKKRVYPVINPDGTINKFNLFTGGSWIKLAEALLFIFIAVGLIIEYSSNLKIGAECLLRESLKVNLSNVNFSNLG